MKVESDKVLQYQSAYLSNQKAYAERMEQLTNDLRSKEDELLVKIKENESLQLACDQLKEENNTFKGRCANL